MYNLELKLSVCAYIFSSIDLHVVGNLRVLSVHRDKSGTSMVRYFINRHKRTFSGTNLRIVRRLPLISAYEDK